MNHMGDANVFVLFYGGPVIYLTALMLLVEWRKASTYSRSERTTLYGVIAGAILWTAFLLCEVARVYFRTRHDAQLPFGFGPTHGQLVLAAWLNGGLLFSVFVILMGLLNVYRKDERRRMSGSIKAYGL